MSQMKRRLATPDRHSSSTRPAVAAQTLTYPIIAEYIEKFGVQAAIEEFGSAASIAITSRNQTEEIMRAAAEMVKDVQEAQNDFTYLKPAVIRFIRALDGVVLGDEDILELAAAAVIERGKSAQLGLVLFNYAFTRAAEREAKFFGETNEVQQ